MGKWERVTWFLRTLGGVAGAIAIAPVLTPIPIAVTVAYVAGLVSVGSTFLSINLPKDPWPDSKRAEMAKKKTPEGVNTPKPPAV